MRMLWNFSPGQFLNFNSSALELQHCMVPIALQRRPLSSTFGGCTDPCGAFQSATRAAYVLKLRLNKRQAVHNHLQKDPDPPTLTDPPSQPQTQLIHYHYTGISLILNFLSRLLMVLDKIVIKNAIVITPLLLFFSKIPCIIAL